MPAFDRDKLSVRNLRREDKARIIEIDAQSVGYQRSVYFDRKFRRYFGEDAPILLALVAEYAGTIVGFIMGEINTGEYGIPEPVASVDTIGMTPEFQKRGVGRILLEEYCQTAEKSGIRLMTTLLNQDFPQIIDFFKAQGFKPARMSAFERKLNPSRVFEKY